MVRCIPPHRFKILRVAALQNPGDPGQITPKAKPRPARRSDRCPGTWRGTAGVSSIPALPRLFFNPIIRISTGAADVFPAAPFSLTFQDFASGTWRRFSAMCPLRFSEWRFPNPQISASAPAPPGQAPRWSDQHARSCSPRWSGSGPALPGVCYCLAWPDHPPTITHFQNCHQPDFSSNKVSLVDPARLSNNKAARSAAFYIR